MHKSIKVVFLTASLSSKAGGVFFTITSLSKELLNHNINVSVLGFNDGLSEFESKQYGGVPVNDYSISRLPLLSSFGYSKNAFKTLSELNPDIIHLQGIWMYHSYVAFRYKRYNPKVKLIIEPHGMLDSWALKNSAWKKKIVGQWFEYDNLKSADCIHALCQSEYDSVKHFGLKNTIAIIPNGITLPTSFHKEHKVNKTLLYIGRIHPKKGLINLIQALCFVRHQRNDLLKNWRIVIAGWDQNNYQRELEKEVISCGLESSIKFVGPVFGSEKDELLRKADAFILPSLSEGLPMSVLEAWAYRLPVLMTDFCNLPEGFSNNAALRIEPNPKSISEALIDLFSMADNNLDVLGDNAYNLVLNKFSWQAIADDTVRLYDYLVSNVPKPDFVYD